MNKLSLWPAVAALLGMVMWAPDAAAAPHTCGGHVYASDGTTPLSGVTVEVAVNGTDTTSGVSDASGAWTTSVNKTADSILTIYIKSAAQDGVTVTLWNNADNSTIDVYQDTLIVRSESGTTITNANLVTAAGAGGADVSNIYTVSGTTVTVAAGKTLKLWSGHTWAPGGNVYIKGDLDMTGWGTISGSWNLFFNGSSGQSFTSAGKTLSTVIAANTSGSGVTFSDALTASNFVLNNPSGIAKFKEGVTHTFSGKVTVRGSPAATATLDSGNGSTAATLSVGGASSIMFATVSHITKAGAGSITANLSTDGGGNTGITFNSTPIWQTNQSAKYVVGQTDMTSSTFDTTAATYFSPSYAESDGAQLYVSETNNARVLIYNSVPAANNASADLVVGQTNMTSSSQAVSAFALFNAYHETNDGLRLYLSDSTDNRLLIFNNIPTSNNASADVVVGQTDMSSSTAGTTAATLNFNKAAYSDGVKLFICDSSNNRVLIYNSIPTANNASADVVVGQADMISAGSGATAFNLNNPQGVFSDGVKLYIADSTNNRVLIFNSIPASNNASADVVIGQTDMASSGAGTTAFGMAGPQSVFSDGTKLYVTENSNNRVLIFNSIPTSNNASANLVIGQTDMVSSSQGTSASALTLPNSAMTDGRNLYVLDNANNRVLIFTTLLSVSGHVYQDEAGTTPLTSKTVELAINGTDSTSVTTDGSGAYTLSGVIQAGDLITVYLKGETEDAVAVTVNGSSSLSGVDLYQNYLVARQDNAGSLTNANLSTAAASGGADISNIYAVSGSTLTLKAGKSIKVWTGDTFAPGGNMIAGGDIKLSGTFTPGTNTVYISGTAAQSVTSSGNSFYNLIVRNNSAAVTFADAATISNNFISNIPGVSLKFKEGVTHTITGSAIIRGQAASKAVIDSGNGSSSFTLSVGATNVWTFANIKNLTKAGAGSITANLSTNSGGNTGVTFNAAPGWSSNVSAAFVTGQTDMISSGNATTASTFSSANSVYSDGLKMYVADVNSNRVLIYNSIPAANNASADVVVGQTDMISGGFDTTAFNLYSPYSVYSDGQKLYVAEFLNNRILIYNNLPSSNNASADVVVGQTDMVSDTADTTAFGIFRPAGVYSDGVKLYLVEYSNNRVLIYNSIPASNNASANVVVGQTDMVSAVADTTAYNFTNPTGVYSDGVKLYVADLANNRVLIYNSIPASNNASANVVVGQTDMVSGGSGTTAFNLHGPQAVYSDGAKLYVSDSTSHRVLIYNSIPTSNNASADVVIGQTDMTSGGAGTTASNFDNPSNVYSDGVKMYVAEYNNNRVLIFNSAASITVSGHVYSDAAGTTPLASKKVAISVNGYDSASATTDGSGAYSITVGANAGDVLTVYLKGETEDGVAVSVSGGSDISGVDIYQNYLVTRQDNSGSLTNANLSTAATSGGTDVSNIYSVSGSTLTLPAGKSLKIWTGQTFAPGGDVYAGGDINLAGTLTAGTNTVYLNGTGTQSVTSSSHSFYDLAVKNTSAVVTFADALTVSHNFIANVPGSSLKFKESVTHTITGSAIIRGQAASKAAFDSVNGSSTFTLSVGATNVWTFANIKNMTKAGAGSITANLSTNSGGNTGVTFNAAPSFGTNESAGLVVGQTDMISSGGALTAFNLNASDAVYSDGVKLYVMDNSRLLIYNAIPSANNTSADVVVGQTDMISNVSDTTAYNFSAAVNFSSDGVKLYVADLANNRVLIFNSIPTSNNASADVVVGQTDMVSDGSGITAFNFNWPGSVYSDGVKLYVADRNNNRVLIFNSIPTSNNASANVVVGQTDMVSSSAGTTANGISGPYSVYSDGVKLYVADRNNNRILIYNTIPASNNASADVVVGQTDMVSSGADTTAFNLHQPQGVYADGTKLYVADSFSHRVLIYNSIPASNNSSADIVVGQTDMVSSSAGTTSSTFDFPDSVFSDGVKLYVADYNNSRVLLFNSVSAFTGHVYASDGTTPLTSKTVELAVAGSDVNSGVSDGSGAFSITVDSALAAAGSVLTFYIKGASEDGVTVTVSPGTDLSGIDIYQNNLITRHDNGGNLSNANLSTAAGAGGSDVSNIYAVSGSALTMAVGKTLTVWTGNTFAPAGDVYLRGNMTVNGTFSGTNLYANTPGETLKFKDGVTHTVSGSLVVRGQAASKVVLDSVAGGSNAFTLSVGSANVWTFANIKNVTKAGAGSITANLSTNSGGNTGVTFNSAPSWATNQPANIVVGQTDMISRVSGTSAFGASDSGGVFSDGAKLYITEVTNNRVLIYNTIPSSNNASADLVVGQTDMTSSGASTTAFNLNGPTQVYSDGGKLFVLDQSNSRVLIYNSIPAANNASADIVVGQTDMTSDGFAATAFNLNSPTWVYSDGVKLYIADYGNSRVLIYNTIPTVNNASADVVVGQTDMISNGTGTTAFNFSSPNSVYSDGVKMYVADFTSNRVLIYNTIPTSNNASADVVVGQTNMTSEVSDTTAYNLSFASSAYTDGAKLYIADWNNHRALIFNTIPAANNASANTVLGQTDMVSSGSGVTASAMFAPTAVYSDGVKLYVADKGNHRVLIYNAASSITVSGHVYSDAAGTTPLTSKALAIGVNGVDAETTTTDGSGAYSITLGANAGDILTIYLKGESEDAVTVSVSPGTDLSGIDLYQDYLVVRHDNGGSLANANLVTAATGGGADVSNIYSASGTALTMASGKALKVPSGHTFTPGGNVFLRGNMTVEGTFTGTNLYANTPGATLKFKEGLTHTVSGTFVVHGQAASKIVLDSVNGSGAFTLSVGGTNMWTFANIKNLTKAGAGSITANLSTNSGGNTGVTFNPAPAWSGNQSAAVVVGQTDMTSSGSAATAFNLALPYSVYSDGVKLYAADYSNNRVLIYNSIPSSNNTSADVVIGQTDMTSNAAGTTAFNFANPRSVYSDGVKLYIADYTNNRVLIYNTIPTSNNASADVVVGQTDMTSAVFSTSAFNFSGAISVYSDGVKLYVADLNNRVLIFNTIPTANNASADVVVGQTDMASVVSAATAFNLSNPQAVYSDGVKLYIADYANSRILIYNTIPASNNASADLVVGQTDMVSTGIGTTAFNLYNPLSVFSDGAKMYQVEWGNNRVLIYNAVPTANNASADVMIAQTDMVSAASGVTAFNLTSAYTVFTDGVKLYVADTNANRVLIFDNKTSITVSGHVYTDPTGSTPLTSKTIEIGVNGYDSAQATTDGSGAYSATVGANSGDVLTVYLKGNTEKAATVTVGAGSDLSNIDLYQNYLVTRQDNGGSLTNANLATGATAGGSDLSSIYTASGTTLTTASGKALKVLSGHTFAPGGDVYAGGDVTLSGTFTPGTNTFYLSGAATQSITSNSQSFYNLAVKNTSAAVTFADALSVSNNFIANVPGASLKFKESLTHTITGSAIIRGQAASKAAIDSVNGSSAFTLSVGGTNVWTFANIKNLTKSGAGSIAANLSTNNGGNTGVTFNVAPNWATNQAAKIVTGQTDMVSVLGLTTAYSLYTPVSAYSDGMKLIVSDRNNIRLMIYNSIPASNNASANVVVGQTDMVSAVADTTAYNLYNPNGVFSDGVKLYQADFNNSRIMIYNTIPTSNNASADVVVGQTDMISDGAGTTAFNLTNPFSAYSDGVKLYVADYNNNRVLIYNSLPTSNNASADVVVGQTDMVSAGAGTTAFGLSSPESAVVDGVKLYIADNANNRVLIFNSIPASNNASADVVIGQTDMISAGSGTTAFNLSGPASVYSDGTKLYVVDGNNSRVLIYNSIPASNNASADVVIGQTDMISGGTGLTSTTFDIPSSVFTDGVKMYVADYNNNRVLIFASVITISGHVYASDGTTPLTSKTIELAVGGSDLGSTTSDGSGAYSVSVDAASAAAGTVLTLYIKGHSEDGVTVSVSSGSNISGADIVQNYLIVRQDNSGSLTNANLATAATGGGADVSNIYTVSGSDLTMAVGKGLLVWSGHTFAPGGNVYLRGNMTVNGTFTGTNLYANTPGATLKFKEGLTHTVSGTFVVRGQAASKVVLDSVNGSGAFTLSVGSTNVWTFANIKNLTKAGAGSITANLSTNSGGNTGVTFNTAPGWYSNLSATLVAGQTDMTSNGSGTTAFNLDTADSVYSDGVKLYVADYNNNRILIFNSIPASNGASANVVVGQTDMVSGAAGTTAFNLAGPQSVYSDGIRLYVAEFSNHRVLIYNSIPASNNASADIVIGQTDMISATAGTTASALSFPQSVYSDGVKLYVADSGNNRILIFNSIPTTNTASADVAVGQTDLVSAGSGTTAFNFTAPSAVYADGVKLYASDFNNNRILIFNSIPTSNNASADVVVGQTDMVSGSAGTTAFNLSFPYGVYSDGVKLYAADYSNNRVLIFNSVPTSNNASADTVIGQTDMTSSGTGLTANGFNSPRSVYADGAQLYVADESYNRVLIYNGATSITVSGHAYSDAAGTSPLTSKAISVAVNGYDSASATTDGSGAYSVTVGAGVGDVLTVYLKGVAEDGVTVSVSPGSNVSGVDVFQDMLAIRHDNFGSLSNANLVTAALGGGADVSNIYTASGTTLTTASAKTLKVISGHTFAPGGNVFLGGNMTVNGTFTGTNLYANTPGATLKFKEGLTHTVSGTFVVHGQAASKIVLDSVDGSTAFTLSVGGANVWTFANVARLTKAGAGSITANLSTNSGGNTGVTFNAAPSWNTNQSANTVVGQTDMISDGSAITAYNLQNPSRVYSDGVKLYVGDLINNRLLVFNSIPASNNASADVVVGQTDMVSGGTGTTAYSFHYVNSLYNDGVRLYVLDNNNCRVLIFNSIPASNNASADVVVGQTDMVSAVEGTTAYNLSFPNGVYSDGVKLYIADYNSSRVLIYNNIPSSNNASADVVVGQTDMISGAAGTTAYSVNLPTGVYSDGAKLYVADSSNHRVLIFNSIPTANNASADVVVGQTDMLSAVTATTAYNFSFPNAVYTDGNKMYVADSFNYRVLIYNSIPTANNASADLVIGQTDLISSVSGTSASNLLVPDEVYSDGVKLYISDQNNNRVLIYKQVVIISGHVYAADGTTPLTSKTVELAVGGTDLASTTTDGSGAYSIQVDLGSFSAGDVLTLYLKGESEDGVTVTVTSGNSLSGVDIVQNYLITRQDNSGSLTNSNLSTAATGGGADVSNIYSASGSTLTVASGKALKVWASHTFAPGGPIYAGGDINLAGTLTAGTNAVYLNGTGTQSITSNSNTFYDLYARNTSAAVTFADALSVSHNFIANVPGTSMKFKESLTHTITGSAIIRGQAASKAVFDSVNGSSAFTLSVGATNVWTFANIKNMTKAGAGSITANFSTNSGGNTGVTFNTAPSLATNQSAALVVGQTDMVSAGSTTTAYSLELPASVYSDGVRLYVADESHKRVLIFNSIPTSNNASADVVVGQTDMLSSVIGTTAYIFDSPTNVYSDGVKLYLTDRTNDRVLIYNNIPAANNASADVVVGQTDMTSDALATTAYNFNAPYSVYSDGVKLYVADQNNCRILIYNSIPAANNASADVVVGQADMVSGAAGTTAYNLNAPASVYSDGVKLYVADTSNNRVLIYNSIPASNNVSADVVVGQTDMVSAGSGATAYAFNNPYSVYSDGAKLYVADFNNNRLLIYNSIPAANNASADAVIGQTDMTSNAVGTTASTLNHPNSVFGDGEKFYVDDSNNSRVLIFNSATTISGHVYASDGSTPLTSKTVEIAVNGVDVSSATSDGSGAYSVGVDQAAAAAGNVLTLYIKGHSEDGVTVTVSSGSDISGVDLYQNHLIARQDNGGSLTNANLVTAGGAGGSDVSNIYSASGTTLTMAVDKELLVWTGDTFAPGGNVFLRGDMTVNGTFTGTNLYANTPGTTLKFKEGLTHTVSGSFVVRGQASDKAVIDSVDGSTAFTLSVGGTNVWTFANIKNLTKAGAGSITANLSTNSGGNTGVTFNAAPGWKTNQSAAFAVGQTDLTSAASGTTAFAFTNSYGIFSDGAKLYVPEYSNSRVLIFNTIPTSNNASADVVVGQTDMTSSVSTATAFNLSQVASVFSDGIKLYMADANNNRILIYNSIPTSNNASANIQIGQDDMTGSSGGTAAYKFSTPNSVYSDGVKLFVADYANNRVLIYNTIPTANNASADVAVGQTDMVSDGFDTTAYNLSGPNSVYSDGVKLFVADTNNYRILIYNSIPAANNASADVVIGQTDMVSTDSGPTAFNFNAPSSIFSDGTRLYVVDQSNNRVLVYNSIPTSNNASADVVIGQTDMTSFASGTTAQLLNGPSAAYNDGVNMYVADSGNNRILVFSGASAVTISGNVYSDAAGTTPLTSKAVYVSVNGYDSASTTTDGSGAYSVSVGANAGDVVTVYLKNETEDGVAVTVSGGSNISGCNIYQDHLVVRQDNGGSLTNANLLTAMGTAFADITNIYSVSGSTLTMAANKALRVSAGHTFAPAGDVNLRGSMRVDGTFTGTNLAVNVPGAALLFKEGVTHTVSGNFIVRGQAASKISIDSVAGGSNAFTLSVGGTNVWMNANIKNLTKAGAGSITANLSTDSGGNTGVTFTTAPSWTTNQSAALVTGQTDMVSDTGDTTAFTLSFPYDAFSDGTKLFVADNGSNRILIYNTIPTSNNASADVVVGQTDMISDGFGISAVGLNAPESVYSDGLKLFIADTGSNRVLIYNSIPTSNNASANVVVGQTNMTSSSTGTTAVGFDDPGSVYSDGIKLYIVDSTNRRVLIYNNIPTTNNASANVVVGQTDMVSTVSAATAFNFASPVHAYSDGVKLFVADYGNSRVLIFNSIPTANNASADVVVGQTNMTSSTGGTSAFAFSNPNTVYSDGVKLYVCDSNNNRIMIFNTIPASNNASADVVIGQTDMVSTDAGTSANLLFNSNSVYFDGERMYVAEVNNRRVLIYSASAGGNATTDSLFFDTIF